MYIDHCNHDIREKCLKLIWCFFLGSGNLSSKSNRGHRENCNSHGEIKDQIPSLIVMDERYFTNLGPGCLFTNGEV